MQRSSSFDVNEAVFERKIAKIKDFKIFSEVTKNFNTQFSCTYTARLKSLENSLIEVAGLKWGDEHQISKSIDNNISDITNIHETRIIIGTIYKHQELKPSVLKQISNELQLITQPPQTSYCSSKDCLYLEDNIQRIKLSGNYLIDDFVTGIVCAILGRDLENGTFWVEDYCYPGLCPKASNSSKNLPCENNGRKILLLSGLDIMNSTDTMILNILQEWITGMIGNENEQEELANLVAIIIAGNSIKGSSKNTTSGIESDLSVSASSKNYTTNVLIAAKRLDLFLSVIAEVCPIILLPGEFDPSCHTLPQQPLHPQILSDTSRSENFYNVTNPWLGKISSRIISGSSGQTISDIMKNVSTDDLSPIVWLEKTLMWRHFAPTSPDTLDASPNSKDDPFVMGECPDLYFAGNMDKYETKLLTGNEGQEVRLICIPKFSETQTVVLVSLETLESQLVSFGSQ